MKRLYRSSDNKIIAGVIGGIGERFDVDPVILRLVWVLVVVFTAVIPGVVVYLFAIIIVPKRHGGYKEHKKNKHHDRKYDD